MSENELRQLHKARDSAGQERAFLDGLYICHIIRIKVLRAKGRS